MIVPIILGFIALSGIIYLAISQRSSRIIKFSALGALALMILAVIVCLIVFVANPPKPLILPDTLPEDIPPPPPPQNTVMVVMFIVFLIALFGTVLAVSLRGQDRDRKNNW